MLRIQAKYAHHPGLVFVILLVKSLNVQSLLIAKDSSIISDFFELHRPH